MQTSESSEGQTMKRISFFIIMCTLILSLLATCSSGKGSHNSLGQNSSLAENECVTRAVEEIHCAEMALSAAARLELSAKKQQNSRIANESGLSRGRLRVPQNTGNTIKLLRRTAARSLYTAETLLSSTGNRIEAVYARLYLSRIAALGKPRCTDDAASRNHPRLALRILICRIANALGTT